MARNRSEKGPLSDPEVYEYMRTWCDKSQIERGQVWPDYDEDPEWKRLAVKRRSLWTALPESKKAIVRKIKKRFRQETFDAA